MGMRPVTYHGFDVVVSCEHHLARKPMEGYEGIVIHCPMQDEDDFECGARERRVAEIVSSALTGGQKVLVHCSGGLNRSGVIVALALQSQGFTPSAAVALMRVRRDEFVLCNRAFERFVLGDRLPTAETSVFRLPPAVNLAGCEDYR